MKILIVFVILFAGLVIYCIMASASRMSRMEERWLHPPNEDEDGVFLMEEEKEADE